MTPCRPPFTITPEILTIVAEISLGFGKLSVVQNDECLSGIIPQKADSGKL